MTDKLQVQESDDLRTEDHLHTSDLLSPEKRAGDTAAPGSREIGKSTPLFATGDADSYRSQWERIQIGFVDAPHESVERADELVAAVIKRLAEVFAEERSRLERNWGKNDTVSTEDLRVALQRYRSFFDRLLTV